MPAASNVALAGCPANTNGSSSVRESRASKNGTGSSDRSSASRSGVQPSSSTLPLSMLAHRLVWSGSSQSRV